jgi:hypothetical protein
MGYSTFDHFISSATNQHQWRLDQLNDEPSQVSSTASKGLDEQQAIRQHILDSAIALRTKYIVT